MVQGVPRGRQGSVWRAARREQRPTRRSRSCGARPSSSRRLRLSSPSNYACSKKLDRGWGETRNKIRGYADLHHRTASQSCKKMIVGGSCPLGRANETLSPSVRPMIMWLASGGSWRWPAPAGRVIRNGKGIPIRLSVPNRNCRVLSPNSQKACNLKPAQNRKIAVCSITYAFFSNDLFHNGACMASQKSLARLLTIVQL